MLSPHKIFCPTENVHGTFVIFSAHAQLLLDDSPIITVPYDSMNGIPTSQAILLRHGPSSPQVNLCVTEEVNQNLTEAQKEYLPWHFRLGHLNSNIIQWLLCQPSFGNSHKVRAAAHCTPPKCAACEYGKAHRRPLASNLSTPSPEREGATKFDDLFPGSGVSVDHFESKVPGRLYTSRGKSQLASTF